MLKVVKMMYKNIEGSTKMAILVFLCRNINQDVRRAMKTLTSLSGLVFLTPNSDMPPSSKARFHAPKLLSSTAISLGVRPSASFAWISAPVSMSRRRMTLFPRTTAQWRGESPTSSFRLGFAPCFNNKSTESASPWYAAHMSDVWPCRSRESTLMG